MIEQKAAIFALPGVAGQRVLVTAGAAGIGRAIAELLLANGAQVFVCDVDAAALAAYAEAHPDSGQICADVAHEGEVDAMFGAIAERLGGLDALINNAGLRDRRGAWIESAPRTGGAASTSA
jgi:NAD(P)-dependent dehydrogenase (short-subunit alcohol dehydrogenase family)